MRKTSLRPLQQFKSKPMVTRPKEQHTGAELRIRKKVSTFEINFRYSYKPEGDHSDLLMV